MVTRLFITQVIKRLRFGECALILGDSRVRIGQAEGLRLHDACLLRAVVVVV